MADKLTIRLHGLEDVIAAFRDLRAYMPKNTLRAAVRKAAKFLQELIQGAAPIATGHSATVRDPGKLVRNITVKASASGTVVRANVIVNTRGDADNEQNAFYWRFLEEGFHTRSGEARIFPFIAGVVERQERYAAQMVIDAVDEAIQRAGRRAVSAAQATPSSSPGYINLPSWD